MSTFETALKFWWGPPKWWGPESLASFASSKSARVIITINTIMLSTTMLQY